MSEHTDALNAMDGIPASVGFCEPVEGYRYRPNDAVRSITEMACEITHIRQQLNQKQADLDRALARVAKLEDVVCECTGLPAQHLQTKPLQH